MISNVDLITNQGVTSATHSYPIPPATGLVFARKEENKNVFQIIKWNDNNEADSQALLSIPHSEKEEDRRVIMIDASKIVDGYNSTTKEKYPSDAHNDILDEDIATLIWALTKRFAPFLPKSSTTSQPAAEHAEIVKNMAGDKPQ